MSKSIGNVGTMANKLKASLTLMLVICIMAVIQWSSVHEKTDCGQVDIANDDKVTGLMEGQFLFERVSAS